MAEKQYPRTVRTGSCFGEKRIREGKKHREGGKTQKHHFKKKKKLCRKKVKIIVLKRNALFFLKKKKKEHDRNQPYNAGKKTDR